MAWFFGGTVWEGGDGGVGAREGCRSVAQLRFVEVGVG